MELKKKPKWWAWTIQLLTLYAGIALVCGAAVGLYNYNMTRDFFSVQIFVLGMIMALPPILYLMFLAILRAENVVAKNIWVLWGTDITVEHEEPKDDDGEPDPEIVWCKKHCKSKWLKRAWSEYYRRHPYVYTFQDKKEAIAFKLTFGTGDAE